MHIYIYWIKGGGLIANVVSHNLDSVVKSANYTLLNHIAAEKSYLISRNKSAKELEDIEKRIETTQPTLEIMKQAIEDYEECMRRHGKQALIHTIQDLELVKVY